MLALEHGEPLDEAVYCEVMFDKTISGEVPEHRDFIYHTAIPKLERMGVKARVLRAEKTYVDLFTGTVTRGPKKGMLRAFPICGKCYVQRDCKIKPICRYQKSLPADTMQYIGIAYDEQKRLSRLKNQQVSLLAKYKFTEEDAKQLCRKAGLLSPMRSTTVIGWGFACGDRRDSSIPADAIRCSRRMVSVLLFKEILWKLKQAAVPPCSHGLWYPAFMVKTCLMISLMAASLAATARCSASTPET